MTRYLANKNGDWWEVDEGEEYLFIIDTEDAKLQDALKEWGYVAGEYNDKFERFIHEYGTVIYSEGV
ncbi:MAG: hypothetical protein EB054_03290 [Actinobacteria bacterium]|jgi:hypothetical protein|nr:hypothetical protein [Actinomycetota bacterium]